MKPITIDESMKVYNQTIYYGLSNLEDKVDDLRNRIMDLKEDPTVKEYNELKDDFAFLARTYVKDDAKTRYLEKRKCNHPLYGVLERKAICTVCGKRFDYNEDELQELIEDKKLIADGINTSSDKPYPIKKESLKVIREYYLELYNSGIDNVEELVWEHFNEKEKQYKKRQ